MQTAGCLNFGLVGLGLMAFIGCSSAEFEATNSRLANSRLLFLHEGKYNILTPPQFSSASELDAHLAGKTEAYERRFQAGFPDEQEQWFAAFRPVEGLPDALRGSRATLAADAGRGRSADAASAPPQLTYYLVPLEGVELPFVEQVAEMVKSAGFGCVANKPGDATQLPMPPRGGPGPQSGQRPQP